MKEDWRMQRRWHIIKSATQKYVLTDSEQHSDWICWTDNLHEFCLQLLTRGLKERDCYIGFLDFNEDEL